MGEAAQVQQLPTEQSIGIALEMFKPYEHFSKCMLDAYAVLDSNGRVLKCNGAFATLVGLRTKQILKEASMDKMLTLSVAGNPLPAGEFLKMHAPTRIDEVSGDAAEHKDLNLIIGVYPFLQDGNSVGAFILIRDVTAETNLQGKYKDKAKQSVTDALTLLYNRAYFTDYLTSQIATLETFPLNAPQRVVSVIMMDIDFFKKVNDVYGHQAGDYVIKTTAEIARKMFRKTDVIARYGGEEFLAILPGTDIFGAIIAAEKYRQTIQENRYEFEGTVIPVTISIGVAQINIGNETGEQAIARADQALYFSKQNGRNRISIHDGIVPRPPAPA